MYLRLFLAAASLAAIGALGAQTKSRKMTLAGGDRPGRGKCTIEVVVDGAAQVEIRGDTASLKNLAGAPPQWRRFQCTAPLPRFPDNFRFAGVDGRGRQDLVRYPRDRDAAIVRIEDPDNGPEGYTFDLTWGNAAFPLPSRGEGGDRSDDRPGDSIPVDRSPGYDRDGDVFHRDRAEAFRRDDWRLNLFARIREDLDHVQRQTFPFGNDQYRIVRVKQELNQLHEMQSHGRFGRRELDDVINTLLAVVRDNRLAPRDRDALNDDLNRLQDFRAHFRDYGVH